MVMGSVAITVSFAFGLYLLVPIVSRINPALKESDSENHDVRERINKQIGQD